MARTAKAVASQALPPCFGAKPLEPLDGLLVVPAAVVAQPLGEDEVAVPAVLFGARDGRWASRSTRAKSGTASGASAQVLAVCSAIEAFSAAPFSNRSSIAWQARR